MTEVRVDGAYGTYLRAATPLNVLGGNARLYDVQEPAGLLFKQFPAPLAHQHIARIRDLTRVGKAVADGEVRRNGLRRIVWPLDLQVVGHEVVGVIIPRAEPAFFRPGQSLMLLTQDFRYLVDNVCPPASVRLEVVRQLADALAALDYFQYVHGDVSATNMLWCADPEPRLLLIDCDGLHHRGFPLDPGHTEGWTDPRGTQHDHFSDRYALALAVYRAVVADREVDPVADIRDHRGVLRTLPAALADPLARVFGAPKSTDARVRPRAWRTALASVCRDPDACAAIDAAYAQGRVQTSPRTGPRPRPAPADATRVAPQPPPPPPPRRRLPVVAAGLMVCAMLVVAFLALRADPSAKARRALEKALPPSFHHCDRQHHIDPLPDGADAAVQCRAGGRRTLVLHFTSGRALRAFYWQRADVARAHMHGRTVASCGSNADLWYWDNHPKHPVGRMLYFRSTDHVRYEWTVARKREYFVGIGEDGDLGAICAWWKKLPL